MCILYYNNVYKVLSLNNNINITIMYLELIDMKQIDLGKKEYEAAVDELLAEISTKDELISRRPKRLSGLGNYFFSSPSKENERSK